MVVESSVAGVAVAFAALVLALWLLQPREGERGVNRNDGNDRSVVRAGPGTTAAGSSGGASGTLPTVTVVDDLHEEQPLLFEAGGGSLSPSGKQFLRRLSGGEVEGRSPPRRLQVWVIVRVRSDADEAAVSSAWSAWQQAEPCSSGTAARYASFCLLCCDKRAGAAAMVRHVVPAVHVEAAATAAECAQVLHRFIPRIVVVTGDAERCRRLGEALAQWASAATKSGDSPARTEWTVAESLEQAAVYIETWL
ncbi:hypothetical protein CDCA_CDCA03G1077 [Cyanidium caldarium]|uniref:Uncharacterized protein n=1 Tax=Cyanidium caldarium TaxID=2771 RepID=A0AAV9IRX6_CYACA|nr:hypothetical protein CDCA_CDCA03G1077 [Cyanidium caldarium]